MTHATTRTLRTRTSPTTCLFIGAVAAAAGATIFHRLGVTAHASPRRAQPRAMFGGGDGIEVPCKGTATAAVIFLHGLGDSGLGWSSAFPLRALDHVKAILPSAPAQAVSLNMGMTMPSWFDLRGLDEDAADDEEGITEAVARVNRIIDNQMREGIPSERIVVAGFSQGGAVALTAGLRSGRKLAGVVALSTWLPMRDKYPGDMVEMSKELEFFMGHGTADQVVSYRFGDKCAQLLRGWERRVEFHAYPGLMHSASAGEMEDVRDFIARVLPRQ